MGKRSKKEATSSSSTPLIILVIFVLALAARLIYLRQVSAMPTFNVPLIDSKQYDILARNLVYQGVMDRPFFWQGFFYPIYLSAVYLLTEGSLLWARIFQIVLGSTVCVLVFQLGREIFDKRTGILAGVICAFYGPLIFFEAELLATGWASFLSVVIMLLLLKANRKGKVGIYLTIGICGGLSAITRANFLPFFVAAVLFSIFNLCLLPKYRLL